MLLPKIECTNQPGALHLFWRQQNGALAIFLILESGLFSLVVIDGQKLLEGYKKGAGIFCFCCNTEVRQLLVNFIFSNILSKTL